MELLILLVSLGLNYYAYTIFKKMYNTMDKQTFWDFFNINYKPAQASFINLNSNTTFLQQRNTIIDTYSDIKSDLTRSCELSTGYFWEYQIEYAGNDRNLKLFYNSMQKLISNTVFVNYGFDTIVQVSTSKLTNEITRISFYFATNNKQLQDLMAYIERQNVIEKNKRVQKLDLRDTELEKELGEQED